MRYMAPGSEMRLMLYAKFSWKNLLIRLERMQPEAQADCPVAYTYDGAAGFAGSCVGSRWSRIRKDRLFPWSISHYVQHRYRKVWYLRGSRRPCCAGANGFSVGTCSSWPAPRAPADHGRGGRSAGPRPLMADLPLVSVVMPSLNQGHFIRTAIDSVLGQGYPRLELLVFDGQSTDDRCGSPELWRPHPLGFRARPGQVSALNKGFRMASGEMIGWLNADDLYLPGAIAAAVAYFERSPETIWSTVTRITSTRLGACSPPTRRSRSASPDCATPASSVSPRRYFGGACSTPLACSTSS